MRQQTDYCVMNSLMQRTSCMENQTSENTMPIKPSAYLIVLATIFYYFYQRLPKTRELDFWSTHCVRSSDCVFYCLHRLGPQNRHSSSFSDSASSVGCSRFLKPPYCALSNVIEFSAVVWMVLQVLHDKRSLAQLLQQRQHRCFVEACPSPSLSAGGVGFFIRLRTLF